MKLKKLLTALLASILLITGCSTMKEEKKENPVKNETNKDKVNSSSREGEYTFKDGKVSMEDIDLKITKYKVIPVGAEGNEYGKKPVIAFWYDPPYNTGSDGFVYPDNFKFDSATLSNKMGIDEDEAERIIDMRGKALTLLGLPLCIHVLF